MPKDGHLNGTKVHTNSRLLKHKPWLVSEPVLGTGQQIVQTYLTEFSCALRRMSAAAYEAMT